MSDSSSSAEARYGWDEERAQKLLGKHALVGITYFEANGETITAQIQLHGVIVSVDRTKGIELSRRGLNEGESFWLPAATGPFEDAAPGSYTLHTTGEVIANPDLISTWTATKSGASNSR